MPVLYDTGSGRKVPLAPVRPDRVGIYTCGPTVYRYVHIGNLRTWLLTDLLVRSLRLLGFVPYSVQNITDMGHMHQDRLDRTEDKVIAAAREAGKSAREIAAFFTGAFFRDCRRMRFLPADLYPRASEHVSDMIDLAKRLTERGATYGEDGWLYLDVAKAPGYGELSGAVLGEGETAERTDAAIHLRKRRPEDFTLWLPAEPGREFSWESPWGRGWPGWHIECAAMAVKYLGDEFDLHVGGSDLRFPHHENSRAMARTATGGAFARIWLHGAHLTVDGKKMSKSLRNEYTLDDLEARGISPEQFRYHCLTLHYRTPMNYTFAAQEASSTALARLRRAIARAAARRGGSPVEGEPFRRRFREAAGDDLNLPKALSVVHEAVHAGISGDAVRTLAAEWDTVLAVDLLRDTAGESSGTGRGGIPEGVIDLAKRRARLRRERDYRGADALRERIREAGYEVTDRPDGTFRLDRRTERSHASGG
ncbi:MAG: cysteine--tRNA ligase [Deltaproteobacteria bacterium]